MSNKNRKYLDPSQNVKDMVMINHHHDDELRMLIKEREDDLRKAEAKRVDGLYKALIEHFTELGNKEASRLDSIRQVDVLNQAAAAKSALDAIQALAVITTTNADNLRNTLTNTSASNAKQVSDLAASIATSTAASFDAQAARIAALEKSSAEGIGKGRVIDPQLEQLASRVVFLEKTSSEVVGKERVMNPQWDDMLKEIKMLLLAKAAGGGEVKGRTDVIGWIIAGIMFIIAISTFVLANLKA